VSMPNWRRRCRAAKQGLRWRRRSQLQPASEAARQGAVKLARKRCTPPVEQAAPLPRLWAWAVRPTHKRCRSFPVWPSLLPLLLFALVVSDPTQPAPSPLRPPPTLPPLQPATRQAFVRLQAAQALPCRQARNACAQSAQLAACTQQTTPASARNQAHPAVLTAQRWEGQSPRWTPPPLQAARQPRSARSRRPLLPSRLPACRSPCLSTPRCRLSSCACVGGAGDAGVCKPAPTCHTRQGRPAPDPKHQPATHRFMRVRASSDSGMAASSRARRSRRS
jgi:hypothetical protein